MVRSCLFLMRKGCGKERVGKEKWGGRDVSL